MTWKIHLGSPTPSTNGKWQGYVKANDMEERSIILVPYRLCNVTHRIRSVAHGQYLMTVVYPGSIK
jgi:hypothetical protein